MVTSLVVSTLDFGSRDLVLNLFVSVLFSIHISFYQDGDVTKAGKTNPTNPNLNPIYTGV